MREFWRIILYLTLLILPLIVLAICLHTSIIAIKKHKHKQFIKNALKLQMGMLYQEVLKIMGDGNFVQIKNNEKVCIWELTQHKSPKKIIERIVKVLFQDDKVVSIYRQGIDKKA